MNFGLIGAGGIGRVRAMALQQTPGCKLIAVADIDAARARAVAPQQAWCYPDYKGVVDNPEVEAVIISTPPPTHEEITFAALGAGKHVLCEKPLAPAIASCRRMVDAARQAGRILTTGFNHRYFPAVQFLKKTIDNGQIGKLDHVRAFGGHTGLSEFKAPWMYDAKVVGGGALMDVGIHVIDLARYVLGEVSQVYGVATSNVWKLPAEDNGIAVLRSPEGVTAALHATWTEWKGYRFYIEAYGERGMAKAYYAPMFAMSVTMDKPGSARKRTFKLYPEIILREKFRGWETTTALAFREEFLDFVKLAQGQKQVTLADGFAGLRAVQVANAVYESSRTGEVVKL